MPRSTIARIATAALVSFAASAPVEAQTVRRSTIQVEHVRVESKKSYAAVKLALEQRVPKFDDRTRVLLHYNETERLKTELARLPGEDDLVIFSAAPHGDWLEIAGGRRNAIQYVIGNVLVASRMIRHQLPAALYAPLRVVLYENGKGTATFEYDRPSTLFGQFGDEQVTAVARDLDAKIERALVKASE
jgi:uncharacterized protein (DUF302 family)